MRQRQRQPRQLRACRALRLLRLLRRRLCLLLLLLLLLPLLWRLRRRLLLRVAHLPNLDAGRRLHKSANHIMLRPQRVAADRQIVAPSH